MRFVIARFLGFFESSYIVIKMSLRKIIAVGGFLVATYYLLKRFLKNNIKNNSRRFVHSDYIVKE
jgi:hypothetical protein